MRTSDDGRLGGLPGASVLPGAEASDMIEDLRRSWPKVVEANVIAGTVGTILCVALAFWVPDVPRLPITEWGAARPFGLEQIALCILIGLILAGPVIVMCMPVFVTTQLIAIRYGGAKVWAFALSSVPPTVLVTAAMFYLLGDAPGALPPFTVVAVNLVAGACIGVMTRGLLFSRVRRARTRQEDRALVPPLGVFIEAHVLGTFVGCVIVIFLMLSVPDMPRLDFIDVAQSMPLGTRTAVLSVLLALALTLPCAVAIFPLSCWLHLFVRTHGESRLSLHALATVPQSAVAFLCVHLLDGQHDLFDIEWWTLSLCLPAGMLGGVVFALVLRASAARSVNGEAHALPRRVARLAPGAG